MAKKKAKRTAVQASSALEPQDQSTFDFDSNRLGTEEEEATCTAPAAKSVGVMFSNDYFDSFSAALDEELPEVGKPDTDHDLSLMEEEKHSADTISTRSSDAVYIDTPQASQSESILENQITADGDRNLDTLKCDYLTPIVHVYVGSEEMSFLVHKGILAQSSSLVSKCNRSDGIETLRLPEIQPRLFVLLLTYLYKWDYQTLSTEAVENWAEDDAAARFKTHANLYCLASAYKLGHLVKETIKKMESIGRIGFRSLVDIARKIYPKIQADDVWFTNYFKNEVIRAFKETPNITEDKCILDIYKNDGGRLAVDVFTTITTQYANPGARVEETVAGSGISLESDPSVDEIIRCKNRAQHLRSLKKNGPWKECQACSRERDQMIQVGQAVVSVAIKDLLPVMSPNQAADQITNATVEPSTKAKKKKMKKALRTLGKKIIPIASIVFGQTMRDCASQCPSQAEHLKQSGGRWQWEDCPQCLEDRTRILHELQLLDPSQSLAVLSNLSQKRQQQPIPISSEEQIVPDVAVETTQEIGPAEDDFSRVDAPAVDATETHSTVIDSSIVPTAPELLSDMPVSCSLQDIDPPEPDSAVFHIQPPDTPASHSLDTDHPPAIDQNFSSFQACPTEEAMVDEFPDATESLIIFENSPSLPEKKAVKGKKMWKVDKALRSRKTKGSTSDRTAEVSPVATLDPRCELLLPEIEASGVGYWDQLATSQHSALDDTPAEVPRSPLNSAIEYSLEENPVVNLGKLAGKKGKKGKKQKKLALPRENSDVSKGQVSNPEEQMQTKDAKWYESPSGQLAEPAEQQEQTIETEWHKSPPGQLSQPIEQPQDIVDDWATWGRSSHSFRPEEQELQVGNLDSWGMLKTVKPKKPKQTIDDAWSFWAPPKMEKPIPEKLNEDEWANWGASRKVKKTKKSKLTTRVVEIPSEEKEEVPVIEDACFEAPQPASPPAEALDRTGCSAPEEGTADPWDSFGFIDDSCNIEPVEPPVQFCPSRMSHLLHESEWSSCILCRRELSPIAQKLARENISF